MRRIFLLLLFSIVALAVKAQNKGIVKAVILDSLTNQPIPLATVSVLSLKDTSLIAYTVTDKNGVFTLHNLHEDASRLLISHVGYQNVHINLKFTKSAVNDLGKIFMSSRVLQEVIIKGERVPILIKKDTIEFDAEAFKTRPNAMVEDLLKKLPGVQVNQDGSITVNGINVSKIKVNGKTFFAGDVTIATKNLDADMISKVQVYDDRDDDPDHLIPEYNVTKILNLKFKKRFAKGALATLGGGAGTQDRYTGDGFLAKFQDDLQLSVNVRSDNLNNTGNFSGNQGGFTTFSYKSPGQRTLNAGSFDYTQDITPKLKLHIEYRADNSVSINNTDTRTQQNVSDTIFNTIMESMQRTRTNDQNFHAETEYKPDSLTILKYVPDMEYEYQNNIGSGNSIKSDTYVPLLNTDLNGDNSNSSSFQYSHSLSYYRKVNKKGASITITNFIGFHPQTTHDISADNLVSYVAALPSDTLNRSAKNVSNDISEGLNLAYHYPVTKKLSTDIVLIGLHDQNSGNLVTYDEDFKTGLYNIFLADQSSDLVRDLWGESLTPSITYNFTDNFSMKAGLTSQAQQIDNHFNTTVSDLNQNFFYLLPSGEIHLKDMTLSYAETVQQPSINSLLPITIVYSPLYTFIGNPDLKPTYFHNLSFNYRKYNYASGIQFFFNTHVVIEENSVVNEQNINAEGANITTPINRNGRYSAYLNGNFSKRFKKRKKWEITAQANLNASAGHYFFIVNGQNGYQNTQNIILTPQLYIDWNNLLTLEPSYHINYATTEYKLVNYPGNSFTTQGAGMAIDLSLPKNFRWRVSYDYSYNPTVSPGFQQNSNLLDLFVSKRIQAGKGEIGLVCYDILDQNVNSMHFVSANTINDVQNQVLKRYILLTYTYHFKKFK